MTEPNADCPHCMASVEYAVKQQDEAQKWKRRAERWRQIARVWQPMAFQNRIDGMQHELAMLRATAGDDREGLS